MKRISLLVLLNVALVSLSMAQNQNITMSEVGRLTGGSYTPFEYKRLVDQTKLTPEQAYYTPDWKAGTLLFTNEQALAVPAMRFNMAMRLVEVQDPTAEGGIRIIPAASIRGFILGPAGKNGQAFEVQSYRSASYSGKNFFESLNQGPVRLFLLHEVVERPAARNEALGVETRAAQYLRSTQPYVLRAGQERVEPLSLTKKAVLRLFNEKAPQIEAYASQNNLSYEQLPNVVRMMEHYQSLIK
ncbi:hypothetical protein [Hymenobacter sp. HDW8]|uniref:hypothetical protein n=1 Tax=Hymenobacter sp. HDW8 TaxID=2714932 RepID=UPI00140C13B9|nr:hypothetical protein [Hymenobacter sp. HDW8]QIL76270.1 hypothetical protein G7064_10675 [Hymenobacter sp. HDW8]